MMIAVILLVLAIVVASALEGRPKYADVEAMVRGEPGEVLDDVVQSVAGIDGTRTRQLDANHLGIAVRYTPDWAWVLAFVLFPVGLLALIAKTELASTMIAVPAGAGLTVLRVSGRFDRRVIRKINQVIGARSQRSRSTLTPLWPLRTDGPKVLHP